jgi:DNA-binding NarL/FixJ family response regulator
VFGELPFGQASISFLTSKAEEDILSSYDLGVNGFVIKPVTFESLVSILKAVSKYWFEIVEPPPQRAGG